MPHNNNTVIALRGVSFSYGEMPILSDIDFEIPKNDFLAIIGPNGGGKTTLLKLILGLLSPTKGHITILGTSPERARRYMGYMPQQPSYNKAFPITVFDMVLSGRIDSGLSLRPFNREDHRAVDETLEFTGLKEYRYARISELSGGQVQRALLARAIVNNPKILLLDEPTANIDVNGKVQFRKLFAELNRDITIIMVSHDLDLFSKGIKRVACINRTLYLHDTFTPDTPVSSFTCPAKEVCPVELLAHLSR